MVKTDVHGCDAIGLGPNWDSFNLAGFSKTRDYKQLPNVAHISSTPAFFGFIQGPPADRGLLGGGRPNRNGPPPPLWAGGLPRTPRESLTRLDTSSSRLDKTQQTKQKPNRLNKGKQSPNRLKPKDYTKLQKTKQGFELLYKSSNCY